MRMINATSGNLTNFLQESWLPGGNRIAHLYKSYIVMMANFWRAHTGMGSDRRKGYYNKTRGG